MLFVIFSKIIILLLLSAKVVSSGSASISQCRENENNNIRNVHDAISEISMDRPSSCLSSELFSSTKTPNQQRNQHQNKTELINHRKNNNSKNNRASIIKSSMEHQNSEEKANQRDDNQHHETAEEKLRLKILVFGFTAAYSHFRFQSAIADTLAEAGHEVHMLQMGSRSPWNGTVLAKRVHRVIHLALHNEPEKVMADWEDIPFFKRPFEGTYFPAIADVDLWLDMFSVTEGICRILINNVNLLTELRAEKFDVGIGEIYDGCLSGIFNKLDIQTKIGTLAIPMFIRAGKFFGIPPMYSYVTNMMAPQQSAPKLNFFERTLNVFNTYYMEWAVFSRGYDGRLLQSKFGDNFPSTRELMKSQKFVFVNTNEFFDLPMPTSSKIVQIGGIVCNEQKETTHLTEKVQTILDNSVEKKGRIGIGPKIVGNNGLDGGNGGGTVLISFGTMADPRRMGDRMRANFIEAIAKFPEISFIWRFPRNETNAHETAEFWQIPNLHTFDWLDQKAILAHPNLRAFVTHCGQNSAAEAVRAGIPVVGVPLFGDQLLNAATLKYKRVGVILDVRDLNQAGGALVLSNAFEEVLKNQIFSENAKLLKRKIELTPFSPQERLIKWIEFAAQFPELDDLNLPTEWELGWLAYYSLDVALVGFAFVTISLFATFLLGRSFVRTILDKFFKNKAFKRKTMREKRK